MRRLLFVLVILGLGAAAFVGRDTLLQERAADATPPPGTSPTVSDDRAAVEALMLTKRDFPAGWTQAGKASKSGLYDDLSKACPEYRPKLPKPRAEAESASFAAAGAAVSAGDLAAAFVTVNDATDALRVVMSDRYLECLGTAVAQDRRAMRVVRTPSDPPDAGDEAIAARLTCRFVGGKTLAVDVVGVRQGRVVVLLILAAAGEPWSTPERQALVDRVLGRLPAPASTA